MANRLTRDTVAEEPRAARRFEGWDHSCCIHASRRPRSLPRGIEGRPPQHEVWRLMPDLLAFPFLICAVVACIAGMVRGFAGFGAAMLMTPVFSALHGPAVGVVLCLLLEIAVALPLLPAAAVVGVPLGNFVLTRSEPEPMRWAISAIVLGAVALLASGWRFVGRPRMTTTLAAGASSGFLNGLAGMAGPPIA